MITALLALVLAQQSGNGSWTDKAPLPASADMYVLYRAAATSGGLLYVAGMRLTDPWNAIPMASYSPVTDTWTVRPSGPAPAGAGLSWYTTAAVAWQNDILVFGSYSDTPYGMTVTWRYSPGTESWTRLADVPYFGSAVASPTCVYLVGGWDFDANWTLVYTMYEFDPETGTATRLPNLPGAPAAAAWVDGRLIFAGYGPTQIYDPAAGWSLGAAPPLSGGRGAVIGKRLYLVSPTVMGWPQPPNIPMLEYNVPLDKWVQRPGPGNYLLYITTAASDAMHLYAMTNGEGFLKYAPPDYGTAPDAPSNPATAPWNNGTALFTATVTDPDADQVRIQVEVNGARFMGPLSPEGFVAATSTLVDGHYSWRCRAVDWNDNVSAWVAGADFDVDTTAPSQVPTPLTPSGRVTVATFSWTDLADDGGSPVGVEIQVSRDPQFTTLVPKESIALGPHFWRLRAVDAAGNIAPQWSASLAFEVDDGVDHGAGDGCGLGVGGRFQLSAFGCLLAAAMLIAALRRR